jgi:hypothetical protein
MPTLCLEALKWQQNIQSSSSQEGCFSTPRQVMDRYVPVLRVGDMSIFSAFIQAFRYDSMLTVIESNFFEEFSRFYLVLKPFVCNLVCKAVHVWS